jgi:hypothetical protein
VCVGYRKFTALKVSRLCLALPIKVAGVKVHRPEVNEL